MAKQKGGNVGSRSEKFKITLHIVIKQKDGGPFVAHCLDFDLVTTGNTLNEVYVKMKKAFLSHIRYAVDKDLSPYQSAPQVFWKEWWEGIQEQKKKWSKGILINPLFLIWCHHALFMNNDTFSLDEGQVVIQWPSKMSQESFEDFKAWLDIITRKAKRSVQAEDPNEEDFLS